MSQPSQNNRYSRNWLGILSLIVLVSSLVFAQTDSGRVRGTVNDAQGGLLPGATVTLTSLDTGRIQTITADSQGAFNFDVVPRGHYKVQAEQKGFKLSSAEFDLEVSQVKEVNFKLEVGQSSQIVDVSAEVPLVDTE